MGSIANMGAQSVRVQQLWDALTNMSRDAREADSDSESSDRSSWVETPLVYVCMVCLC